MSQQARNMSGYFAELPERPKLIICDHDTTFTHDFQKIVESDGIKLKRVGPLAPNMNAYAERCVQSIQQECLDRFVVFGEDHLRHIVREYTSTWPTTTTASGPTRASATCR